MKKIGVMIVLKMLNANPIVGSFSLYIVEAIFYDCEGSISEIKAIVSNEEDALMLKEEANNKLLKELTDYEEMGKYINSLSDKEYKEQLDSDIMKRYNNNRFSWYDGFTINIELVKIDKLGRVIDKARLLDKKTNKEDK